jgi:hypothetical protein|tara:strand:- start:79 stop:312 length:234 start_codon:yes stop_codon:yes gene_type:complete
MTIKFIKEELNDQGNIGNEFYNVIENGIEYSVVKCFDYGGSLCEIYVDNQPYGLQEDLNDIFSEELVDELWGESDED